MCAVTACCYLWFKPSPFSTVGDKKEPTLSSDTKRGNHALRSSNFVKRLPSTAQTTLREARFLGAAPFEHRQVSPASRALPEFRSAVFQPTRSATDFIHSHAALRVASESGDAISFQLGKDPRTKLDLTWSGVRVPVDVDDPQHLDGVVELTGLALKGDGDRN